jgi:hypothetical protein
VSVPTTTGTGATQIGDAYFTAVANADLAALRRIACPGTTIKLTQEVLDQVTSATPSGPAIETGDTATEIGVLKASDGSSATVTVDLHKQASGVWCLNKTTAS